MNKSLIRNFAIWARNKLIADVSYHARLMGITKNGIAQALPQSTKDVEFFDIGTAEPYVIRGEAIQQRKSLVDAIRQKEKDSSYETAYSSLMEEIAYTWFNRLIAVRFMEVNDYLPAHVRVLSSEGGKLEPDIVTNPFDAELFFAESEDQKIIQMKIDNKLDDVFRILFVKQCRELSKILPRLFEGTNDYTELLLSVSFIDQEGVVYHLVHDIPEEDFNIEQGGQVEIIGWLYQYYNAELKDETFALLKNNVKVTKERIPSATQLFTPDWIVRYMVENSLGRLWVEGHPNELLKSRWKYYLEEAEQEESVKHELEKIKAEYAKLNPEDIKVIDPCMGSGHILIYAFDVLMQIYESAGYTQRDAAKSIIKNNLFGLDIDDRAAQLAYFAVMMKARQYNRRILGEVSDCNVYAIKESNGLDRAALVKMGDDLKPIAEKLVDTFVDAKEYGSIINVDVTLEELDALDKRLDDVDRMSDYGNLLDMMYASILSNELSVLIRQARVMVQKYDAVITNPPYMGYGNMNPKLSRFVKDKYLDSKMDLFACFITKGNEMLKENGYNSMVTMQSWMFLSGFEKMRRFIIEKKSLTSLMHMDNMVMGIAFGTAVSIIRNTKLRGYKGIYNYVSIKDIVNNIPAEFPKRDNRFARISCDAYKSIPGFPIAYWVSQRMVDLFKSSKKIRDYAEPRHGMSTGNNDVCLKLWFEINYKETMLNACDIIEFDKSGKKYAPYKKGGDYRRWYGNNDYVIAYDSISRSKMEKLSGYRSSSTTFFFKKSINWSDVSNGSFSARMSPCGFVFDGRGASMFCSDDIRYYLTGIMTSKIASYVLEILNPTITFNIDNIASIPVIVDEEKKENVDDLVENSVEIAKADWDLFETSWDFKKHPLI